MSPVSKKSDVLPGAFTAALRRVLPGISVFRGKFRDDTPAIVVANPNPDGLSILIRLHAPFLVNFGNCVLPRVGEPFGHWRDIVDVVRKIVAGTLKSCTFAVADGSLQWHELCDTSAAPIGSATEAFCAFFRQERIACSQLPVRAALAGAVLDVEEWDPDRNRHFHLRADWFKALALPTALDALLACVEAPNPPGDNLLEFFQFPFGDLSYECRNYCGRWLLRSGGWEARNKFPLVSAPSLEALLSSPMPSADPPVAIRDILAGLPANAIFIRRDDGEPWNHPCWVVETPLDPRGVYGLLDDKARCPDRFRAVTLRHGEARILNDLGRHLAFSLYPGIFPERHVLVPAPDARPALGFLDKIANAPLKKRRLDHYDDETRAAAGKLRPVFESAAALGMPVSIRPFRFAPPPPP